MSRILILGDVHLGKSKNLGKSLINSNLNSRVFDQNEILNWVISQADENLVSDIVLTGDIFEDTNPDHEIIKIFIDWIKVTSLHEINIHICLGNHDYKRIENIYYSVLDIINSLNYDNVFVYYNPETILIDDVGVTFLPFMDRKSVFKDSLADAKSYVKMLIDYNRALIPTNYKSILIGHLALEGSLYIGDEIDDVTNEIILPLNYFDNYDYTWMGHVHKYQILSKSPYISHIGSMDISDFGESEEEKYIIIFDCENASFKEIKIPTKKLEKIKLIVDEENSIEDQLDSLDIKNKIISIDIEYKSNTKSIGKSKVKEILSSKNPYIIVGISETKEVKIKENTKTKEFKISISLENAITEYCNQFIDEKLKPKFLEKSKELIKEVK